MGPEPTDREKILAMADRAELEGAREQFKRDGRLTDELANLIAMRIERVKP
jgi:hypothetical protein